MVITMADLERITLNDKTRAVVLARIKAAKDKAAALLAAVPAARRMTAQRAATRPAD